MGCYKIWDNVMDYYISADPWAAIALAEAQNVGYTYTDGVTQRRVGVDTFGGMYFVPVIDDVQPEADRVDFETMATYFEEL